MTSGTIQHVQLIAYGVFAMLNAAAISSHAAGTETTDRSAAVQAVSESKDRRMNDTATKIAEFKDSFVVGGLDFNGDGTQLATSGMVAGPEAHVWTWRASGQGARVLPMNSPAGGGEAIRYSVDGTFLAVGHKHDLSGSGVIRVWNTKNWEAREVVDTGLATEFMGLEFSPDGKFLARTVDRAGRPGSTLVLNKIESGAEVWGFDAHPFFARTLALSPTGQFVALGGHTSALGPRGPPIVHHPQILIVDLSRRAVIRTIPAFPDNNEIQTLAWSPDGTSLAAGNFSGPDAVRIFDAASGRLLASESAKTAFVSGLSYSRDGRYLAEGHIDGKVRIWDGQHKHLLQVIPVDDHFHTALSISRDSRYVAIASGWDVSVWELN